MTRSRYSPLIAARLACRSVAFPTVHQVDIIVLASPRHGQALGRSVHDGPRASDDFMSDREQPAIEEREPL